MSLEAVFETLPDGVTHLATATVNAPAQEGPGDHAKQRVPEAYELSRYFSFGGNRSSAFFTAAVIFLSRFFISRI